MRGGVLAGLVLACLVLVACARSSRSPSGRAGGPLTGLGQAAAAPPSAPGPVELAVVASSRGILAVPTDGTAPRLLAPDRASWCAVDPRAEVVWLIADGALRAIDLEAGPEPTPARVVVSGIPEGVDEIIIDHGAAGRIGGGDPVAFFLALELVMGERPRVVPELGCAGDAAPYCYEEGEGQGETGPGALLPALRARRDALARLKPSNPGWLRALHLRGQDRPLQLPQPEAVPLPRVSSAPPARCEVSPEDCGRARPLDGSGLWRVVVDNSRGDYFHQREQLYDPRTRQFVSAIDPRRRARAPLADEPSIEGLLLSRSGRAYLHAGRLLRLGGGIARRSEAPGRRGVGAEGEARAVVVWGEQEARGCGFVGGYRRVGGPRE